MIAGIRTACHKTGIADRRHGCHALALTLLAAALALAGCGADPRNSLIPHVTKPIPGTDQSYPNLASVPDKAPDVTPKSQRTALEQKLAADNISQSYHPDLSVVPPIPPPPPTLPEGFTTAEQPVKIAEAASPSQTSALQTPAPQTSTPQPSVSQTAGLPAAGSSPALEATLPSGASTFGALGRLNRVAIVLFSKGSSTIDPRQVSALKPVVRMLHQRGGVLQVVGYAASDPGVRNSAQDKMANFDLSVNRANAVARVLMRLGVKPAELIVSAESDRAPVASIEGVSDRAANERADIYLEY